MSCVVDASVAIKWFLLDETHVDDAVELVRAAEVMIAPDLLVAETCNAAWRSFRLGRLEAAQLPEIAAAIPRYFTELVPIPALAPRAMAIARQLAHPVYDCFYIALAEMRAVRLITADDRLLRRLTGSPWRASAVHVAEYPRQP